MTLPDVLQDFELDRRMDRELLEKCRDVIDGKSKSIDIEMSIENCQRTFGSTLSYHLAMKYNEGNHFSRFFKQKNKLKGKNSPYSLTQQIQAWGYLFRAYAAL